MMSKIFDKICDVAVVAGSAVGVGLITGKETQVFVGNVTNAVIFAVVFCTICTVFREFCRKNAIDNTVKLARFCFGRFAGVFNAVVCACGFVCIVACLAGVEQCLRQVFDVSSLPLYSVATAFIAAVIMSGNGRTLKIVNVVSIALTVILFVVLALTNRGGLPIAAAPRTYMPVTYALFTLTMTFSAMCRLGCAASKRQNVGCSVAASVLITALLLITAALGDFSKPLPTISGVTNPWILGFACVTISLAATGSMVVNALPIVEQLYSVIPDKTMCSVTVFGLSCAFSMFGFDFLVKFGYIVVAVVGFAIVLMCLVRSRSPRHSISTPCPPNI